MPAAFCEAEPMIYRALAGSLAEQRWFTFSLLSLLPLGQVTGADGRSPPVNRNS
jgi:hypothetical protein